MAGSVRVPQSACPACGVVCNGATLSTDPEHTPTPRRGDLTICVYCSTFLQFGPDLELAILSPSELRALPADEQAQLWKMRRVVHALPAHWRRPQ